MYSLQEVNAKLDYVNSVVFDAQDYFCPMETFKIKLNQKFIVSAKLAKLSKMKSQEFKRSRYSSRFKALKKQCRDEVKAIKQRRINAAVEDGEGSNSWLSKI